jgi:hypothetical protein
VVVQNLQFASTRHGKNINPNIPYVDLVTVGEVMRAKFFLKVLGKIFLLIIIPILLIIKLWWDSVLPLIVYLQFLLLWAQTEIGMGQSVLSSAQFEPSFDIKEETVEISGQTCFDIYLVNISENPAYYVGIGGIFDLGGQEAPPQMWPKSLKDGYTNCLPPKQPLKLCSLSLDERKKLMRHNLHFDVLYSNKFGDRRILQIMFSEDSPPLVFYEKIKKPGVLLNTFEEIISFWLEIHRTLRRLLN